MEDIKIKVNWKPLGKIKTIGHELPDGWWYIYLPFDNDWHHVPASDVEIEQKTRR